MRFTTEEAAAATNGTVVGPSVAFDGVTIDSREATAGQLFVPVVAERDGHDFIPAARTAGATACFVDRNHEVPTGITAIQVNDTLVALTALGTAARDRLEVPVIGVTGSVGKTTTKDLLAGVLSERGVAHVNAKSFNNEMGVPLTLLNAPHDVTSVVVEMGARGVGHIEHLCAIARPTVGIVTSVAAVHTSEFGDVATVARAKGELVEALGDDGWAVLNTDNDWVAAMGARTAATVVTYGLEPRDGATPEITATNIAMNAQLQPSFTLITPAGRADVQLTVRGRHNVSNSLAAAAVGHITGMAPADIAAGLMNAGLSPWRMELHTTATGASVINDAYNANAVSMAAGLQALAALDATRRFAVLGVMAELGPYHDAEHERIATLAADLGVTVIAFREAAYGMPTVDSIDEAVAALGPLGDGDAVLLKGSRVAGLEALAAALTA